MKLGIAIRQLRKRRGLTQDELAHQAGTTAANISRIEADKYRPGAELLGSLAFVLGVKVYELMALAEGMVSPDVSSGGLDPDEETLLSCFRKMPSEEQVLFKALGASLCRIRREKPRRTTLHASTPESGL